MPGWIINILIFMLGFGFGMLSLFIWLLLKWEHGEEIYIIEED